jgi:RHS repeat-associated protein
VSYPDGTSIGFGYDAAGNRTSMTAGASTTNYTYDAASELTSAGSTSYIYDPAGNRVSAGSASFTYDDFGYLATATSGAASIAYQTNGDGLRVSATTAGNTSTYTWDQAAALPELLSDGTTGYLSAGATVLAETGASSTSYTLTDVLGSVRSLTDGSGSVSSSASYDVFGSVRGSSGSIGSLGYTGAMSDASGLTYLQARSLDPATGTFTSRDPMTPGGPGITGYNPYPYAGQNPTTFTDPSGRMAFETSALQLPSIRSVPWMKLVVGAGIVGLLLMEVQVLVDVKELLDRPIVPDDKRNPPRPSNPPKPSGPPRPRPSLPPPPPPPPPLPTPTPDDGNPQVWRLITDGWPFNWKPSSRDERGMSGTLGGPAVPGAAWHTDPGQWAIDFARHSDRTLDLIHDHVFAADRAALAMLFSVDPDSWAGSSWDPYHVSIGGTYPGLRAKGTGWEWNVNGTSQSAMERLLRSFFHQVWP